MSDTVLRNAERQAWIIGDPEAQERLRHERCRNDRCCAHRPETRLLKTQRYVYMVFCDDHPITHWSSYLRREAVSYATGELEETWADIRKRGYRCRKVEIVPVGRDA